MLIYNFDAFDVFVHKTSELSKIVKHADLVIAMNVHNSMLRKVARKDAKVIASNFDIILPYSLVFNNHIKLYRNDKFVFFSTANCSPSNLIELTIRVKRSKELDEMIDEIVSMLESKKVSFSNTKK